jgi:DHA2 family multidrug resistance protein
MDRIPKEAMGNATSMFNLMRNLGGGFGIAAATTFLFRRQQFHTHLLGEHVSLLNTPTQGFLRSTQSAMMMHGGDPAAAATQSYVALWGTVQRQAAMLAFVDTFRAMAIVFLLVLPFLFIMKRPIHSRSAGPMH